MRPDDDSEPGDEPGPDEVPGDEAAAGFSPPTHVFFENEPLIRALNDPRRGENDAALARRLFTSILDATLIALVPEGQQLTDDGNGELEIDGEIELSFVLVRHEQVPGDIVPVFTDEGALAAFMPDGGRYVALAVRDLFPLLIADDGAPNVVINPGGDEALLLTPRMVQDLVDAIRGYGADVLPADGDEEVVVEVAAAERPLSWETGEQIREVLARHPAIIRCVQLQWFMPHRHDEPSLVLAMELSPELEGDDRRFALAALWRELAPLLRTLDRQIEMVDLAGQRHVIGELVETLPPFYERATPGD